MWAPASPVAVGASPFSLTPRGPIMRATAWPADLFGISGWVCEPVVSRCSGRRQPATGHSETLPLEPSLASFSAQVFVSPNVTPYVWAQFCLPRCVSPAGWLLGCVCGWEWGHSANVAARFARWSVLKHVLIPELGAQASSNVLGWHRGHCACAVCRPPRGQALLLLVLGVSLG